MWESKDQGFLVECRAMEGGVSMAKWYGIDEVANIDEALPTLLEKFGKVFEWPEELPPRREIEHHIHLKKEATPVNVRPYICASPEE